MVRGWGVWWWSGAGGGGQGVERTVQSHWPAVPVRSMPVPISQRKVRIVTLGFHFGWAGGMVEVAVQGIFLKGGC